MNKKGKQKSRFFDLFSNKKGASIIMILFEVVAVVFIVSLTLNVSYRFAESDTIKKITFGDDFSMMVNTLVGVPGDAVVEYPQDLSNFIVLLEQGSVMVTTEESAQINKVIRFFNLPTGYRAEGFVKNKARVCLEKKKKKVIVKECE